MNKRNYARTIANQGVNNGKLHFKHKININNMMMNVQHLTRRVHIYSF